MLDGLKEYLKLLQVTDALKATKDRDTLKVMIDYTNKHET